MADAVFQVMARQGVTRDILYDPGFPLQNADNLWNYGAYHVTGYAYTYPGVPTSWEFIKTPQLIPNLQRTLREILSNKIHLGAC